MATRYRRTAGDRVEVRVERPQRILLEARRGHPRSRPQPGDDRDPAVDRRLDDHARPHHARLVEAGRDPGQGVVRRDELLEAQAPVGGLRRGHDEDPHRSRVSAVAGTHRVHARQLGRDLPGQVLEVLRGHGPPAGAERDRAADLCVLDLFPVHAAGHRPAVLHPAHERDGRLEDADGPRRQVAEPAASGEVDVDLDALSLRRHGPVGAHRSIRLADGRAEGDLAGDGVQHEVAILRPRAREVRDLRPLQPPLLVVGDPDGRRPIAGHDRSPFQQEALARHALGDADDLVDDHVGVDRGRRAAHGGGRHATHARGRGVERLALLGRRDAGAEPPGPELLDDRDRVPRRDVEDHLAVAVEASRRVAFQLAGRPAVARPCLPRQGRPGGVDADALDDAAKVEAHRVGGSRLGDADEEQVAGHGRRLEGREIATVRGLGCAVHVLLAVGGGEHVGERDRDDREVVEGREDHGVVGLGADGRDLRPAGDPDGVRLGRRARR
jgi:hypothetical protein